MALLVTGATGHIGGALVAHAASSGQAIVAVYRSNEPPAPQHDVVWVRCDLDDAGAVQRLAAAHAIDACIHAAAVSNEAYARPHPRAAVRTNVGATANLLECARVHAWRRFVLVSTGSVFQRRTDLVSPIGEEAPPAPGNVYGTTKVAAELLARMYRSEYGVSAVTVRISWVFGPPVLSDSPARGPIPSFLMRALRGEPIREGGADFAASFTFVADVANGLIALATAAELRHACYHLGPGRNFSAREVAGAVMRAVPGAVIELAGGTEPWTRYTAMRAPLAGTRLRDDTGFELHHSLEQGIERYAEWMRDAAGGCAAG